MNLDKIISDLFKDRWTANLACAGIDEQKKQLYKTLKNQVEGFWSGDTAYHLAVDGGFLVDGKRSANKQLTAVGRYFMRSVNSNWHNELNLRNKTSISRYEIKAMALGCGFKTKQQSSGEVDLNEYVYDFAELVLKRAISLRNE